MYTVWGNNNSTADLNNGGKINKHLVTSQKDIKDNIDILYNKYTGRVAKIVLLSN